MFKDGLSRPEKLKQETFMTTHLNLVRFTTLRLERPLMTHLLISMRRDLIIKEKL